MTCREGHPARHPDFEPGNQFGLATKHGAFSPRKVGARAELVRSDLLQSRPDLADDPDSALPTELYCRAVAREELAHEGLEHAAAHGLPISPRLLEAATAAARAANELGTGLGIGPRASAELRQIKAQTAVTMSVLVREAPAVLEALRQTLTALGLDERSEEFSSVFADRLALVAGDDDDEE
jgi:hypothetical protein